MRCDFEYCIYNKGFICILDDIWINAVGVREECIIVEIEKEQLEKLKEEQLNRINKTKI